MESILEALNAQVALLFAIIPALLKAFIIILVGYIIARTVRTLLERLLAAIGIDSLADRLMSIDLFKNSKINLVPSVIIPKAVYWFIMIIFII